jgi:chromosome segregation protein
MVNYEYSQNIEGSAPLPFKDIEIESLPQKYELPDSIGEIIKVLKNQLRKIGAINPEAQAEYEEVKQRFNFLSDQTKDLEKASTDLRRVIDELDVLMVRDFVKTFKAVNSEFSQLFTRLFNGGSAKLTISDESDPIESGIEIEAKLPGKREQGLALLSGGERSLAAVALVFALLKVSPTPFCVLDEVDAMLDESNVGRFCDLLLELSRSTQFILITHNRTTVQVADVIYGVTMGRDSSTQVLSLKLDEVDQTYVE